MNKPANQPVSTLTGVIVLAFSMLVTFPLEFKNLMQKEMEAETVDYVEWKSGKRVEGTMLSIMSFTGKLEGTLSSFICLQYFLLWVTCLCLFLCIFIILQVMATE